jgi:hypothetical protein
MSQFWVQMNPKIDILRSVQQLVKPCKGTGTSQRSAASFFLRVHICVQVYVRSIMAVYYLVYDHNGISRGIEKL